MFHYADGKTKTKTNLCCVVDLEIDGKNLDGEFYVLKELTRDVIAGVDFMQKWEIALDLKKEKIIVGIDPEKIEIVWNCEEGSFIRKIFFEKYLTKKLLFCKIRKTN